MLGIKIRSVRHLLKKFDKNNILDVIAVTESNDYRHCKVIKYGDRSILLLNNFCGDSVSSLDGLNVPNYVFEKFSSYVHIRKINEINRFGISSLIYINFDLDDEISKFIATNKKIIGHAIDKYDLSKSSLLYTFYILGNASPNYVQWMINTFINERIPINIFKVVMSFIDKYPNEIKKLSKGTITAYRKRPDIITLLDEIAVLKMNKRCSEMINKFNTVQKKILKSTELTHSDRKNLSKFKRLSNEKQINFIKKASTFDNANDILKYISFLVKDSFKWDKNSVLEYMSNVDGMNYNIILDSNNILILEALDYESIKLFGKTTNWCISKNKKYWSDYVSKSKGSRQFVLFDFNQKEDSEYSIIGFTVNGNTITHAHSFTNADINKCTKSDDFCRLISFYKNEPCKNSIYTILDTYDISIESIIGNYNMLIIKDVLSKMENYCIIARNSNWRVIKTDVSDLIKLGVKITLNSDTEVIIFFRIKNGYIAETLFEIVMKENKFGLYNERLLNLDLVKTNISFFKVCFESGIQHADVPFISLSEWAVKLFEFGHYDDAINIIKTNNCRGEETDYDWYQIIHKSLIEFLSFELIDKLYSNGIKLCDVTNAGYVCSIIEAICCRFNIFTCEDITKEEFENFLTRPIGKIEMCNIPFKYIINTIIDTETDPNFKSSIIETFINLGLWNDFISTKIKKILNNLVEIGYTNINPIVKKKILSVCEDDSIKCIIRKFTSSKKIKSNEINFFDLF